MGGKAHSDVWWWRVVISLRNQPISTVFASRSWKVLILIILAASWLSTCQTHSGLPALIFILDSLLQLSLWRMFTKGCHNVSSCLLMPDVYSYHQYLNYIYLIFTHTWILDSRSIQDPKGLKSHKWQPLMTQPSILNSFNTREFSVSGPSEGSYNF